MGIPPNSDPEAKVIVSRNGSFLEEKFLSKEVSGRKVELDEVIIPPLELEGSTSQKVVPTKSTLTREEANDDDHETSDQVTPKPRRMTRMRTTSEWYVILSWKSCC